MTPAAGDVSLSYKGIDAFPFLYHLGDGGRCTQHRMPGRPVLGDIDRRTGQQPLLPLCQTAGLEQIVGRLLEPAAMPLAAQIQSDAGGLQQPQLSWMGCGLLRLLVKMLPLGQLIEWSSTVGQGRLLCLGYAVNWLYFNDWQAGCLVCLQERIDGA